MSKKNNNIYLFVAISVAVVAVVYIYFKCKISCKIPELYTYNEKLDSKRLVDEHNICRYDPATSSYKCRSTGLTCTNPGYACGPLSHCDGRMCCHSGNGKTGYCRNDPTQPCYNEMEYDCGGSHGTTWY